VIFTCQSCDYAASQAKSVNFHCGSKHPEAAWNLCLGCGDPHPKGLLRALPQRLYGYCLDCRRPRLERRPVQVLHPGQLAENQRRLRAYLREHPCTDCGEPDIVVLEFDHLRDKTANVSQLVRHASWARVLEEIAKCEVACANCHRRRTARRAGYHSWQADVFEELTES
jgi:hypothetical protein